MNEKDFYLTISRLAEGQYKEKGSKFLAFAMPAEREETIKSDLEEIRKKYHDARHHCYAYVLGKDAEISRANDDGEPSHSAGDPILGQIRSRELTNVLVVVVRYFGGTKLGIGGLVHAYKTAASEALDNAGKKQVEITRQVAIQYPYESTSEVMSLIHNLKIIDQQFTDTCSLLVEVNTRMIESFLSDLLVLQEKNNNITYQVKEA